MLAAYPPIESQANWLDRCLRVVVTAAHESVAAGNDLPEWPDSVPAEHREALRSRTGLGERLVNYAEAIAPLDPADRDRVLAALSKQNEVETLVSGATECERLTDLPAPIRGPLRALYDFAFGLLIPLDIRDEHEKRLIAGLGSEMCPFCGCERFEPGGKREDLDHYLARSVYPYATVNLENLVPMGDKCNQGFKGQLDILFHGQDRCTAYFPFGLDVAGVDLTGSDPVGGPLRGPAWDVQLTPDDERTRTWDRIFGIRGRFTEILDGAYRHRYLPEFSAKCTFQGATPPADDAELVGAIEWHLADLREFSLYESSFLKVAVFEMLLEHCEAGNEELIEQLLGIARERVVA